MMRKLWWPWHGQAEDTSDEARKELEKLEQLDPEVTRLGRELREMQTRNNFSSMVAQAITRGVRERP